MPESTYSLSFDGSGVISLTGVAAASDWSFSCWIKSTSTGINPLLSNGGDWLGFGFPSSGHLVCAVGGAVAYGAATVNDGVWHNLLYVNSSGSLTVYVDGVLALTGSSAGWGSPIMEIGKFTSFHFDGEMDDVAIWTTTRSGTDAANLASGANSPQDFSTGLVDLLHYEEGAGSTTSDASGNGNTGTLNGGVTWSSDVPVQLSGLIYFDAASNSGFLSASQNYTWSHTCAGGNRFLSVDVAILSLPGTTVSSVTYGGVNLDFIGAQSTVSGAGRIECWGLINPPSGSNTVGVNLSASVATAGMAVSYCGVHQTIPTESFNSDQATNVGAANATVSLVTVADNDWVHGAIACDDNTISADPSQTPRNNVSGFAANTGADDDQGPITPAQLKNETYTNVGALATWAIAAYALRPTTAVVPVTDIFPDWFRYNWYPETVETDIYC